MSRLVASQPCRLSRLPQSPQLLFEADLELSRPMANDLLQLEDAVDAFQVVVVS